VQQMTLVGFMSKRSRDIFIKHGVPSGFLEEDPDVWNNREDLNGGKAIVCSLPTTNDHAEQGISLIQEATRSKRFRSEDQFQFALQVIKQSRSRFPESDAKKSTLLKTN